MTLIITNLKRNQNLRMFLYVWFPRKCWKFNSATKLIMQCATLHFNLGSRILICQNIMAISCYTCLSSILSWSKTGGQVKIVIWVCHTKVILSKWTLSMNSSYILWGLQYFPYPLFLKSNLLSWTEIKKLYAISKILSFTLPEFSCIFKNLF